MYAWLAWSPRTLNDYDQTKHGKELHSPDGRFTFMDTLVNERRVDVDVQTRLLGCTLLARNDLRPSEA